MSIKLTFGKNCNYINLAAITYQYKKIPFSISNKRITINLNKIASKHFTINLSKDYYKILGIKPDASEKEIKSAYLTLVKKYHPDVTGGKTTELFKEISVSFKILSDKNSKNFYDANSEKVSKYYYSTTAFNRGNNKSNNNNEKNNNNNNEDYFYEYYEPNSKSKSDFYSKYNSREYHYYGDYYQDPTGKGSYRKINNFELKDFIDDWRIFIPKVFLFVLAYLYCHMISRNSKCEYHFFFGI